jgi:hypothetical protein
MAVIQIVLYLCDECGYTSSQEFDICPAHAVRDGHPQNYALTTGEFYD